MMMTMMMTIMPNGTTVEKAGRAGGSREKSGGQAEGEAFILWSAEMRRTRFVPLKRLFTHFENSYSGADDSSFPFGLWLLSFTRSCLALSLTLPFAASDNSIGGW